MQRERKRSREYAFDPHDLGEMAEDTSKRHTLETMADEDSIQKALDRLDGRFKEPFLMVFVEGLTCAEAAEQLGVPLGTVLSRIHRARATMKEFLNNV